MSTVFLFDIDGTLVSTGGAGRRAMEGAFANLHRRGDVFTGVSFAGMTDRAIVRQGLSVLGDVVEHEIDRVLEAYLELLEAELARAESYRVLPGVLEAVRAATAMPDAVVGLGTGNVKRGAYAKLTRGALHEAFAFGGFGCDAEDRTALLRAGAERGAARLGRPLAECQIIVIGDTPKDVAAAHGIGAACIGVGTGSYSAAQLLACGADAAFDSLAVPEAMERLVSSRGRGASGAAPR